MHSDITTPLSDVARRINLLARRRPPIVVKISERENYVQLSRAARRLAELLGYRAAETSFHRDDRTAHAWGGALDLAFRSGPARDGLVYHGVPYYRNLPFLDELLAITPLLRDFKRLRDIVVEADHIHLELTKLPRRKPISVFINDSAGGRVHVIDQPELVRYSPPVNNQLIETSATYPLLRREFDEFRPNAEPIRHDRILRNRGMK